MKPARRRPVHPAPVEGEALSSWLHRLDMDPPGALVLRLAERTGADPHQIRGMTRAGIAAHRLYDTLLLGSRNPRIAEQLYEDHASGADSMTAPV